MLCMATSALWMGGCLFAYFSFTLGEAPESKGAEALEKSLLIPQQMSCSPEAHIPS